MRSYFRKVYCNLDIKYKAGRSKKEETREKKEVKAKNVGTVERERELYFKEIKCSFVRQFNNCKITENGSNTIICVRKKDRL
jgi:hypothetical protein